LLTIARGVATSKEALNFNTLITEYLSSAEYQKLEKTHSILCFKRTKQRVFCKTSFF